MFESKRKYIDYLNEISSKELVNGLVGFGLFSEKLPPIFTSKDFCDYCIAKRIAVEDKQTSFIFYESTKYDGGMRAIGVPNPFSYYKLCDYLGDILPRLKDYFDDITSNQSYKVSRIHLRKMSDTSALFKMNYKNFFADGDPEPDLLLGKKSIAYADISNCFPSMYTHAIAWALVGKEKAKKERNRDKYWQNKLDKYTRNMKEGETQGVLIGPHASNLLSEIILSAVDAKLSVNFRYTRNIDDYTCYASDSVSAKKFIIALGKELRKYGLLLNNRKTIIKELPAASVESWVRRLRAFIDTYEGKLMHLHSVREFLDLAIELMNENSNNAAIINYAINILAKKEMTKPAIEYFLKTVLHLLVLYPYLASVFDKIVLPNYECYLTEDILNGTINTLYKVGVANSGNDAMAYAIYFALKYETPIDAFKIEDIINLDDCILLTVTYLYAKMVKNTNDINELIDLAKKLNKSNDEYTFDRFWLFIYTVLTASSLKGNWKALKKNKTSFVRKEYYDRLLK